MHIAQFQAIIDHELAKAVQRHHPLDWKEDAVTHDLLIRWRQRLRDATLYGTTYPIQIRWEAYKFHGKRETSHGDIGVLISYRLSCGALIEGAGFLEAKARARDSAKYSQVRPDQVERLMQRSPQTRMLLYDYDAIPVIDVLPYWDWEWDLIPYRMHLSSLPIAHVTHGAVIPIGLAATISALDSRLYRFAHSLSYQLVQRYFQLHDLDFDRTAIDAVKGFPADIGSPRFVMIVRAAPLGQDLPEEIVPSDNVYGRFE